MACHGKIGARNPREWVAIKGGDFFPLSLEQVCKNRNASSRSLLKAARDPARSLRRVVGKHIGLLLYVVLPHNGCACYIDFVWRAELVYDGGVDGVESRA